MKRQESYLMKSCFINRNKAQASIEFSIAFALALLLMILSCNLFVWLNHNIVQRQREYELTRVTAASPNGEPGKLDFYPKEKMQKLKVFVSGGYDNETYK